MAFSIILGPSKSACIGYRLLFFSFGLQNHMLYISCSCRNNKSSGLIFPYQHSRATHFLLNISLTSVDFRTSHPDNALQRHHPVHIILRIIPLHQLLKLTWSRPREAFVLIQLANIFAIQNERSSFHPQRELQSA